MPLGKVVAVCSTLGMLMPPVGPGGSAGAVVGSGGTLAGSGGGPGGNTGVAAGLLDPDTTTTWNPGILVDTAMNQPLGADGLPVRTTICHTTQLSEAANLQAILKGCAAGTVVQLLAGTYTVSSTIYVSIGGGLKPWTQQLDQRPQKVSSIRGFVEDDRSVRERRPPDLHG
jgi:hypothetical protein